MVASTGDSALAVLAGPGHDQPQSVTLGMSEDTCSTAGTKSYHVEKTGAPDTRNHATQEQLRRKGNPSRGNKTRSGEVGLRGARSAKVERVGPSDIDRLRLIDVDVLGTVVGPRAYEAARMKRLYVNG